MAFHRGGIHLTDWLITGCLTNLLCLKDQPSLTLIQKFIKIVFVYMTVSDLERLNIHAFLTLHEGYFFIFFNSFLQPPLPWTLQEE